jgi:uncharacterized RDD family membrane protein YckC/Tfp pilus assembly protein PilE
MYCMSCGQPVANDAKACLRCGAAVPGREATPIYAGFWRRVAAYVLDSLVLLIPGLAIEFALGKQRAAAFVASIAMWWIYKAALESGARQATLGKRAMGIKVTDLHGERVSFLRASGRYLATLLSYVTLFIGFAAAGFTPRRQCFHDMAAGCLVVRASAEPDQVESGSGTMPMTAGVWIVAIVFALGIPGLGVLAAVAVPAYQDYVVRSKIAEAIGEGARLKPRAAEDFRAYDPAAGREEDREVPATSKYVARLLERRASSQVVIVLDASKFNTTSIASGSAIQLTQQRDGSWACSADGVPDRYLPASCRR